MSEVAITYGGPGGAYHVEDGEGTWHELVRGVTATVPESLADQLLDLEGHDFELDFETPPTEDAQESEQEPAEPTDDDPAGVKQNDPYGGGS